MASARDIIRDAESLPVEDRPVVVDSILRTLNRPDLAMDQQWLAAAIPPPPALCRWGADCVTTADGLRPFLSRHRWPCAGGALIASLQPMACAASSPATAGPVPVGR